MKTIFGRRVVITELDPIPRAFRTAPGIVAINKREREALNVNDGETFKYLADVIRAADFLDARYEAKQHKQHHRRRRKRK